MSNEEPLVDCAYDEMASVASLQPNPRNPNRHPQGQIRLLAKAIQHHGWRHPIVVSNRSGLIVSGHARREAAEFLGLTRAPVDYQDFDSEDDEMAVCIGDNRLAELAEMDKDALGDLLRGMTVEGDYDSELMGYTKDMARQLARLTAEEYAKPLDIEVQFMVIIECDSESAQQDVLMECMSKGWQCRALVS